MKLVPTPKAAFPQERGLSVAQIFNLLYRRFVIGRVRNCPNACDLLDAPVSSRFRQVENLPHSSLKICATLLGCLLLFATHRVLADDTNAVSPIVSYQYYVSLAEDTNSLIISPIVSYQYYDSVGESADSLVVSPI